LLYHDVGKGTPDEDHVDVSLRLCEGAMERIGMPGPDREMVRFLIGKHLALSETMNSRDLEDPLAIELVAHRVGTVERLKALTLLTYGDISAVNPGVMTPWRRSQLWRLYLLTYNELTRELDAERIEPRPADSPWKAAFLDGFPPATSALTASRRSTRTWRWRRRPRRAEASRPASINWKTPTG